MDIPLPDDPPLNENIEESLADIPVPEDTNRYSPSLPIEDDPPEFKNEILNISLPSDPQKLPTPPTVSVLGKEAAKKRLLAFSQSKQSFISQKRKSSQTLVDGGLLKENDAKSVQPKKKKKGVLDKARDTISEIEELKRRENEVMETMQVLFPMWSTLDKKTTPVTSLIIPDGIVERSDRIESVVEKLLSKKSKHERKEQERIERLEERKRKRERREKEIRRLMPKSWTEFNKSGFRAYHFRRQKFKLEKLSEGIKPKDRNRSHEHEREGSKRINLLDTPMVLKKPLVVSGVNNEDIEFPSWSVRYTNTWPSLTYCLNPKYDTKRYMSRKEMFSSVPDNIYAIIKKFLSSTALNKFEVEKVESSRSWWERDSFLIPEAFNDFIEHRNNKHAVRNVDADTEVNTYFPDLKLNELNDDTKENENERFDKNSTKSVSDSPVQSSEGLVSDMEKSYNSDISESELVEDFKLSSPCIEDNNTNDENLASEYEQFIKTIGPNTDCREVIEITDQADEIWSEVSKEDKELNVESSVETSTNKKDYGKNNKKPRGNELKEKKKKFKKKVIKRNHSSDSSSSESSSKSSSSSRSKSSSSSSRSSSTTSSSSSSSSSGSSSSSSSSSSDSTSSSNDSSSESSSSSTSTGTTSSSDSHSLQKRPKNLKRKHVSKKKMLLNKRNKVKKVTIEDNEEEESYIKKNKKNKDNLVKIVEELQKSEIEGENIDIKKCDSSLQEPPLSEVQEGNSKEEINNLLTITPDEGKGSQSQLYEPRDYSPQSRSSYEDISDLSNSSLKSITSEAVISNEQKDTNNSLNWNSVEDSVSNVLTEQEANDNEERPSEGKRHFNLDIFQEPQNCASDVSNTHESNVDGNSLNASLSQNDFKEEVVKDEENDNNNSSSLTHGGVEESTLKSLERYSPTAEDDEDDDFLSNDASVGGSTLDEVSQLVSFGVNSASEEARMLDIPLPPPIETPSEAPPTSFHNILQLPSSPSNQSVQTDVKKKNLVLVGKSPVARLTFGKQVIKLKPMNIFSAEDSDSEVLPEKSPLPFSSSEANDTSLLSSNDALESKGDQSSKDLAAAPENVKVSNEEMNSEIIVSNIESTTAMNIKPSNICFESSSPQSKKSRWDQEILKNAEKGYISEIENALLSIKSPNLMLEKVDSLEKKSSDGRCDINVSEIPEKFKEKVRKEHSRSPTSNDKKRRRERSPSADRDRRRRERVWSPRDRGRFSRDRRRNFRKRSRSKDRRGRRDSPHREYSPNWKKSSPQNKSVNRSPSDEGDHKKTVDKIKKSENILNNELTNEPSTTFDSWNKSETNLGEVKEPYNISPKKKESLSDWDSPERKYSPTSRKESPKRKKSPGLRESPFRSPRNSPVKRKSPDHYRRKESPLRRRTPENRKESPSRRYSPRRSPMSWKRSPDRRRSPYSPRRSSPVRRRVTPDRKRPGSPYRRRLSPSPERKYSLRYSRKSPVKHRSYSISPSRDEKWKWEEEKGIEKKTAVENNHFPKWDYEASHNNPVSDYQMSLADSTISDSELVKEPASPKRMSLDERLKIELGQTNTNIEQEQPQNIPPYHNFYYPPPAAPDQVNYYPHQQYGVNPQPPPGLPPDWNPSVHPPQLPNKLVQVGNVLQVVPTEIPVDPLFSAPPPKIIRNVEVLPPKVLQVGNMLQVVPSQEPPPPPPLPPPPQSVVLQFNTINTTPPSPVAAPVPKLIAPPPQPAQPVSIISLPFPPGSPNVFMKLEEKERRKKEKELRKQKKEEKAARRMLRKAVLKKRLAKANEAENEDNASIVEVVRNEANDLDTSKTSIVLPSPDKGILISIKETLVSLSSKRKSVSFADGIKPGEGTSPSGGEEHPLSPPPLIRKPVKKRKKRKVKVRIIRIDSNTKEDESEEDDLSPPPPPPGTPPPEAYIEYTASGRYLYPVSTSQSFPGKQDVGTVFPPLPVATANSAPVVQFSTPLPHQR